LDYVNSPKVQEIREALLAFMDEHVYPNESVFHEQLHSGGDRWQQPPIMEVLKAKAKEAGLWNLFLPDQEYGAGLSNVEYAPLSEVMGRSMIAPEVFNCAAPDTGNMEVLHMFGTPEQKGTWLAPLLDGEIRSAFAMTEPAVASSDATNIQSSIVRDGDEYVINGRKWWTSGAGHPHCKISIFMGKTDPNADRYSQQSMILVPLDTPGVTVMRPLQVFGFDDAPHGHMEVDFTDVRVPLENMLLGEGRGFEIAQARLGPGRIHHCMRQIGSAERALEAMCERAKRRTTFGKKVAEHSGAMDIIAQSRIDIEAARALVMKVAETVDAVGGRNARSEVAMIKVAVPNMTQQVLDRAIQMHGGGGVSQDFGLSEAWAHSRVLRLADGPDEVHRRTIARYELRKDNRLGWMYHAPHNAEGY